MAPIPRSELKYIRHPVGSAAPRRSKAAFCAKEPSAMLKAGPLLESSSRFYTDSQPACPPQKSVIVGGYFPVPQGRDCAIFGNRPPQTRLSMPASGPSAPHRHADYFAADGPSATLAKRVKISASDAHVGNDLGVNLFGRVACCYAPVPFRWP